MADQPRPQFLRVQPDVLGHPRGDRQPHRIRRQHQRPVLRECPGHGAQQRMHPIRLQHQQVRVTAHDQHIPGQVPEPPRRQPGPHRSNVINREYRHFRTIAAPARQLLLGEPLSLPNYLSGAGVVGPFLTIARSRSFFRGVR